MNAYYTVIQTLQTLLQADEDVNTVTMATDFDTNKKDIFPIAHVEILDAGFAPATLDFNVRIMAMDIRNQSNVPSTDKYNGNDNEADNLNSMLYVLYRLYLQLNISDTIRILSFERPEKGVEVRNNVLDGWIWNLRVEVIEDSVGGC